MTPKKYFLWFLWIPLAGIVGIYFAAGSNTSHWSAGVLGIWWVLAVPALINLFFGPTIYAFWRRKQSRGLIAFINTVIVLGGGGFPGLLLWIWAIKGKARPPKLPDSAAGGSGTPKTVLIGPLGFGLIALLVVLIGVIASSRTDKSPMAIAPAPASSPVLVPSDQAIVPTPSPATQVASPSGTAASIPQLVALAKPALLKVEACNAEGYPIKAGTGFFISADGIVVTNHHVIEDAKQIGAQDLFGNFYRFESIFADYPQGDLALLKFAGPAPHFLTLGSTATALEGQRILVIGNPEGLAGTVSDGLISAVRKDIGLLQITAPISPGSSGSPVLDENGQVLEEKTRNGVSPTKVRKVPWDSCHLPGRKGFSANPELPKRDLV